jgi:hypothetical protein
MKTIQVGGHRRNSEIMWAMVDDEDYDFVSQYRWITLKKLHTTYARATQSNKSVYLHRLIMGLDYGDKRVVNHIDGNGLNNQRENIEICSHTYNNQSINKPNTNKGNIWYYKKCIIKPYRATIIINKVRHSKYFATEEEAKQLIADKLSEYESGKL